MKDGGTAYIIIHTPVACSSFCQHPHHCTARCCCCGAMPQSVITSLTFHTLLPTFFTRGLLVYRSRPLILVGRYSSKYLRQTNYYPLLVLVYISTSSRWSTTTAIFQHRTGGIVVRSSEASACLPLASPPGLRFTFKRVRVMSGQADV